ncbi:helix-turn-helix domain-containing protein [Frankia sp. AgB32]|uniref:helix-turn-helix domain-containing protein n=1 Tax=Frankia sp. AgB32 TaxID=631119 RepID=UPI00200E52E7|nr:helix-turn-helix domain-containing protein [Frankia sp. AgB32]MCK9898030.1 helix-turn-helix domain-containing protein [Frankia sp. AgB32]
MPRGALSVLYSHARAVALTSAPGVSARTCRSVLIALVAFCDRDTWAGAWPAVATLAERAEISPRTARRALRVLETAGIIATEIGGGRKSSRYRIVPPSTEPSPVSGQTGQDGLRSPVSIPLPPFGRKRRPAAAASNSNPKRIKQLPEDLRPLADALTARNLRAAFSLTAGQLAEVRQALAEHGIPALVRAAYAAHKAADPARWWSAWLGLWSGLTAPSRPTAPTGPSPDSSPRPDRNPERTTAGAAAVRAALAAVRRP